MNAIAHKQKQSQRGQSLVEVALFFPIFIILLAGLVEVSQLLITQNRVSSAARAGARFASNGGEDVGISTSSSTPLPKPSIWMKTSGMYG